MIIFTGRQIIAHSHEGATDYLLVSFSQLNNDQHWDRHYFLQPQVEQGNISCIGVMTNETGFYLSPEMADVARLVEEARGDRPVIVFGQSMGGYAALKFSKALRANYVLSFSPYFSVDTDELELPSERERRILAHYMAQHGAVMRPEFKGMGIRSGDVSGRLALVLDPGIKVDDYDAKLIKKHVPETEVFSAWHAGHVIYDATWDTGMVLALLQAIKSPDRGEFLATLTRLRRTHPILILRSLHKAVNRKPFLASRAFRSKRVTSHELAHNFASSPTNMRLIYALIVRGHRVEAERHFAFTMKQLFGLQHKAVANDGETSLAALQNGNRCLLLSPHGTFLAYDVERRLIRLEPFIFKNKALLPIVARIEGDVAIFSISSETGDLPPPASAWGAGSDVARHPIRILPYGDHQIVLQSGDRHFAATGHGELAITEGSATEQRFVAVPAETGSGVLKASSLNWFERTTLAQEVASVEVAATPPRGTSARPWRRWFGRSG
ncbi:hypothetical protein [Lichenicola sp.]|uniref:hypothetical protein n=1 Tax=Lichenicola sp. TaxID=2804529 RepID=UPI003B002FDB